MRTGSRWLRQAAALSLAAALLASCSVNPATGKRQIALIGEGQEIAMGRQADEEIVASLGLYADDGIQRYVAGLGAALAATSERPDLPWTFRVIDDPIVNAFALPGGFIYVTRGIMAHLSSEAELAAVLGHEIGHVTGRHAVERLSKAQLVNVGLGVGAIVSPEFAQYGDLAQMSFGLLFLKYSRDDERQADELGVRYSLRGGYDVREMPEVFLVLKRVGEVAGAGRIPNWLATHPDPEERRQRIQEMVAGRDAEFEGLKVERQAYFNRLDGMVFGPNPREGYFEESTFYHPDLAFQLEFPRGWQTRNQKQAVTAVSGENDAALQLTLAQDATPPAAVERFLSQQGVRGGRVSKRTINGLPAAWANFEVPDDQRPLAGRVVAIRYGDSTYQLMALSLKARFGDYERSFQASQGSFRRLTDPRILGVQPARVQLVRLDRGMSVREFARRYPSSVDLETVALINHLTPDDSFERGALAKRVVGGPAS